MGDAAPPAFPGRLLWLPRRCGSTSSTIRAGSARPTGGGEKHCVCTRRPCTFFVQRTRTGPVRRSLWNAKMKFNVIDLRRRRDRRIRESFYMYAKVPRAPLVSDRRRVGARPPVSCFSTRNGTCVNELVCVRHGPHARQARWLHGFRPGVDPGYGDSDPCL